jgi:tetratricopeptide (TPR) repeat protein/ADP-heptose:LPS heptosyltransferase
VQAPYLQVDRQRQHLWQQRLEHPNELLIGINWQGNPRTEMQGAFRGRSLPLEAFAPIAELPGIRLVSLQKGAGLEQLPLCSFADRFVAAQEQINTCLDFADMAAVMACCDLIISSDSVVPHLAGALGLPVWLLVPAWPDWRWGLKGESTHWYPSMRLFRQQRFGDWQAPMRAIQVALCRDFAIRCPVAGGITEPSAASGLHATAGEQAGDDGGEEAAESSHEELRQQALALVAASEHRAALPLWRQLLHRQPQDLATLVSLAQCLHQLDQHQQARTLSEQAHGLDPEAPGPLNLLGVLALDAGQVQEALGWLRSATERSPDNPRYLNNLAAALQQADQSDAAIELLEQALVLAPELSDIRLNLARNLGHRGDIAAALSCLIEGLEREPTNADLLWNQSLIQLLRGDYAAGWLGYEARFATSNPVRMIGNPAGRRWSGPIGDGSQERLPTLRLVAEQGLGDMIQFARYLPLMRRFADHLEFCVPASMAQLMRTMQLADRILTPEQIRDAPAPDWLPLLSVPRLLGVSPERPLVSEPYLSSDPQRTAFWRQRLRTGAGTLVGINWQGSPNKQGDCHLNHRALPLEALAPIAQLAGIRLVSLQKGHGMEQRSLCSFADRFVDDQEAIDDRLNFSEIAAVLACCDLVISCDTVVPHLAAALGRPTWLLLCAHAEWRWGLAGEETHWYPSMRLFRQSTMGAWQEPVQRLTGELAAWLESQGPQRIGPPA